MTECGQIGFCGNEYLNDSNCVPFSYKYATAYAVDIDWLK